MKSRNFVFTVNNYTKEDIDFYQGIECKYVVFGYEVAPETGTKHLQGYIMFNNPRSVKSIVSVLRGHIEVAQGNPRSNYNYCTKGGDFYERGVRPKGEGKRTDIEIARQMTLEGSSMYDIMLEINSYQAVRFAETLKKYRRPEKPECKVMWFYGGTGTGKTRTAFEIAGPLAWISGKNLKWWEGYDEHEAVIIDDFRKDFCTFHELLRILDRYPYSIECKGGSRWLTAKLIIITCPYHPAVLYETKENVNQLLRRIHEIRHFALEHGTEVAGNNSAATP